MSKVEGTIAHEVVESGLLGEVEGGLVSNVERDLSVEERSSCFLPVLRDELEVNWVPRFRSRRRVCDSEKRVEVVEEVEGLMKVFEDLGEDLVRDVFEGVGGDRIELFLREGTRREEDSWLDTV